MDHRFADVVLDGRAGEGDLVIRLERAGGPRLLRLRVLDVLCLVEDDPRPRYVREDLHIAVEEGVARDHDRVFERLLPERLAPGSRDAVVNHDGQARREAGRLLLPVPDDRGRADQQDRAPVVRLPVPLHERERLDRLAEPHVVGQACAEAQPAQKVEPRIPARLTGEAPPGATTGRACYKGATVDCATDLPTSRGVDALNGRPPGESA